MDTHKQRFFRKYGIPENSSLSIEQIAMLSGYPLVVLKEVYKRGIGASRTNLASVRLKKDFSKNPDTKKFPASARLPPERWGYARVYSFVDKGKTWATADSDLVKKYNLR
jgi:hypothetical protein